MSATPSYIIGIDIGGTKIAAGIVRFPDGSVHHKRILPTLPTRGPSAVLADVLAIAEELLCEAQANERIIGLGLGVCELVDADGRITSGHTIDWRSVDVQGMANTYVPSVVEADVRAHAKAEAMFGAGRDYQTWVFASVGTGISACLVQNSKPFAGARGNALVLASGPITIVRDDGTSESQILETFASGPAIAHRFGVQRAEYVFAAAAQGNKRAQQVLETAGTALGASLGWLANSLDPAAIVVGGGLGLAGGVFWEHLVTATRAHIWSDSTRILPIRQATLRAEAGIIGAAASALDRLELSKERIQ